MTQEQQPKMENINDNVKHIVSAADCHSIYAENFDTKENAYLDGVRYGAHVALTYASQHSYSEQEQWVSCSERLPKESGLVEICLADSQDIYISFYKKSRKMFQVWGAGRDPICDMKTTHWKPMPKPPMHICRELDCNNKATKEEYPGNSYFVCDVCYEKLLPAPPKQ